MTIKKSLGKDLDTVFNLANISDNKSENISEISKSNILNLNINKINPGKFQPRKSFDQESLKNLAESIVHNGIVQPIIVREVHLEYEIIAGERRWMAAQIAGLTTVPVLVYNLDNKSTLAVSLIENLQREDLNPIDIANAFSYLQHEFKLTHEEIGKNLGYSRTAVTNYIRLLLLTSKTKELLQNNSITVGHAKILLNLDNKTQDKIVNKIIKNNLSVRETEKIVNKIKNNLNTTKQDSLKSSSTDTEKYLSDKLSSKVKINTSQDGKNKIIIYSDSEEHFDWLIENLNIDLSK